MKNVSKPKRSPAKNAVWVVAGLVVMGMGVGAGMALRNRRHDQQQKAAAVPPDIGMATLRVVMPKDMKADLFIDDQRVGSVQNHVEMPVAAGVHRVKISRGAARCEQEMNLHAGKITTVECILTGPAPSPRLDNKTSVTWSFKSTAFHEAMGVAAKSCGLNLIVPDDIRTKVNAQITGAPCNEALESVLEAQGLWYAYDKDSNLVRVGPRRQLDAEREHAAGRPPSTHKRLPPSEKKLDMDFKEAPLRDLLPMLTISVGKMNLVIPDDINVKTTVYLKNTPWDRAFEAVLEAHGLWYRYREEGKIIRIAPRRQLDAEDEAGQP